MGSFFSEGGIEYELSDEVKINFNIMSINGLKTCFMKYLELYNDEPIVYANYMRYIMSCNFLEKLDKTSVCNSINILKKSLEILPLKIIKDIIDNSKCFRLIINYTRDTEIGNSLIKNKDIEVIKYIFPELNKYCVNYNNILEYIIDYQREDLFSAIILNNINNIIIEPTNKIEEYLKKYYLHIVQNRISYISINTITIKNGVSKHCVKKLHNVFKNKYIVTCLNDIYAHKEKNADYLVCKENYKYIIYKKTTTQKFAFRFGLYNSPYDDIQITKVKTIVY